MKDLITAVQEKRLESIRPQMKPKPDLWLLCFFLSFFFLHTFNHPLVGHVALAPPGFAQWVRS